MDSLSLMAQRKADEWWEVEALFYFEGEDDPEFGDALGSGETAQAALAEATLALSSKEAVADSLERMNKKWPH